jgi:RNA polymerase sigma-70 factor, ECF subfamily
MQPLTLKSAAWWNKQPITLPPPFRMVFMMRVMEQMNIE